MKKFIAAGALALTAIVSVAPAAEASSCRNRVTLQEFRRVQHGFALYRVQRIWDGRGKVTTKYSIGGHHYQHRQWNPPGYVSWASATFKDGHLIDKSYYN